MLRISERKITYVDIRNDEPRRCTAKRMEWADEASFLDFWDGAYGQKVGIRELGVHGVVQYVIWRERELRLLIHVNTGGFVFNTDGSLHLRGLMTGDVGHDWPCTSSSKLHLDWDELYDTIQRDRERLVVHWMCEGKKNHASPLHQLVRGELGDPNNLTRVIFQLAGKVTGIKA